MTTSGNNSPSSGEVIFTNNTNTLFNVNTANVTKLHDTNYLMWSLQIHALIDGYELSGYLDGSTPPPPPTVTVNDATKPNPDFTFWKRQDRLLYSALLGAMTTSVQPLVSRATTTADAWTTLADTFAKASRSHFKQIKDQIKVWTKGNKLIDEYVRGLTVRFDELAILGKPMDHEDQIEKILAGLPEEYKPVVDQIESKDSPPTITEVHERLRNREVTLRSAATSTAFLVSANVAQYQRRSDNNNNNNNYNSRNNNRSSQSSSRYNNNNNWQGTNNNNNNNRSFRPYLGKCQICHTQGHSARRCPQLHSIQSSAPPRYNSPFTPWQPRANMVANMSSPAILDSGATHHITSDLNNLTIQQPYNGGDDLTIADGSTMPITHTGLALLPLMKGTSYRVLESSCLWRCHTFCL
ncbi:PREDICTED: probable serine/threonine-protein kinase ndrD [Camelina sativa]|uniref:Probable serine/threonine-protein kinase ndrD n=1 Tax=Camelina sativa TaxID=90675 RepID=A0ABM0WE79_CAMSA|nr:PREDICTED: probable serine/threonine-protein kinase ndrD [Camelina sativa]